MIELFFRFSLQICEWSTFFILPAASYIVSIVFTFLTEVCEKCQIIRWYTYKMNGRSRHGCTNFMLLLFCSADLCKSSELASFVCWSDGETKFFFSFRFAFVFVLIVFCCSKNWNKTAIVLHVNVKTSTTTPESQPKIVLYYLKLSSTKTDVLPGISGLFCAILHVKFSLSFSIIHWNLL